MRANKRYAIVLLMFLYLESEMFKFLKSMFTIKKVVNIDSLEITKWLPIKYAESSWNEIVIRNDRGWLRICTCLAKRNGSLSFYDHNEIEIKGFNPTEFLILKEPVKDKEYAIAVAKHFELTGGDLK